MPGVISRWRRSFARWRHTRGVHRHQTLAAAMAVLQTPSPAVWSFDVFGTLVRRRCGSPEAALTVIASIVSDALRREGCIVSPERWRDRRRICEARTRDPVHGETTLAQIHSALANDLGLHAVWAERMATLELEVEFDLLEAAPGAREALARAKASSAYVVATSDMYWPSTAFAALFARLSLPLPDRWCISSENAASKHRGTLFPVLCSTTDASPEQIAHIGDDPWADVIPARQAGVRCAWLEHPLPAPTAEDDAFSIGRDHLGPLLTAFVARVAVDADRTATSQAPPILAFLARDGWLLRAIYDQLRRNDPRIRRCAPAESHYLYLSRMSVLPASFNDPNADLRALASMQGRDASAETVTIAAGLDSTHIKAVAQVLSGSDADPSFTMEASQRFALRRAALRGFLTQSIGLPPRGALHLIDIGWYGTIPMALHAALPDLPASRVHLLGRRLRSWPWTEPTIAPSFAPPAAVDEKRADSADLILLRFLAVLETVCGPNEGTCLGYARTDDGTWKPVLGEPTRMDERTRGRVQAGILDAASSLARSGLTAADHDAALATARNHLVRLIRRPTNRQATAVSGLVYDIGWASRREIPFIENTFTWSQAILHPIRFLNRLRRIAWVEGSLAASAMPGWSILHRGWTLLRGICGR